MLDAITVSPGRDHADRTAAWHAVSLHARLPAACDEFSPAEIALLGEWLYRITASADQALA